MLLTSLVGVGVNERSGSLELTCYYWRFTVRNYTNMISIYPEDGLLYIMIFK